MRALGPFDPESRHPVEKMLRDQFSVEVSVLSLLTAVILAPLFEEILFRGIFQSWLVKLLDRSWNRVRSRSAERPGPFEIARLPREPDHDLSWEGERFFTSEGEVLSERALTPFARSLEGSGAAYWTEDFGSENPEHLVRFRQSGLPPIRRKAIQVRSIPSSTHLLSYPQGPQLSSPPWSSPVSMPVSGRHPSRYSSLHSDSALFTIERVACWRRSACMRYSMARAP